MDKPRRSFIVLLVWLFSQSVITGWRITLWEQYLSDGEDLDGDFDWRTQSKHEQSIVSHVSAHATLSSSSREQQAAERHHRIYHHKEEDHHEVHCRVVPRPRQ